MTYIRFILCALFKPFFFLGIFSLSAVAAPLTPDNIWTAAQTFIEYRYRTAGVKSTQSETSSQVSQFSVSSVEPIRVNETCVGYIADLTPSGFVLMRSDDTCPPVKLYTDAGDFSELPPDFITVMYSELSHEMQTRDTHRKNNTPIPEKYALQWDALLNRIHISYDDVIDNEQPTAGPLLTTKWNQDYPYNFYAPDAAGGPGGKAYAGCVACAMAQIIRYHEEPYQIVKDDSYTDTSGNCTGSHSASDAGLDEYDWNLMPTSISVASSDAQIRQIARLMFHCGVIVSMNFEATGSGAYSTSVDDAMRTFYTYTCDNLTSRSLYSDSEWYNKISASISDNKPIYYSFRNAQNSGHAVVCDGAQNNNEIHMNMGWGGAYNAWYNMDSIAGWNYYHQAIFNLTPPDTKLPDLYDNGESYKDISPDKALPNDTLDVSCAIINGGNIPSIECTLSFYASPDTTINHNDYFLGEISLPVIQQDDYYSCDLETSIPADLPAGEYWVGWVIDSDNLNEELEENNNTAYIQSKKLTVFEVPVVTSVQINNDSISTSNRSVVISIDSTGGATHYQVSENQYFSGAYWYEYASTANFTLSPGNETKTVYVRVKNDVTESEAASDTIVLNDNSIPLNDNFNNAYTLASNSGTTNGTTINSTAENGEPAHSVNGPFNSIWYSFSFTKDGSLNLNTHNSLLDTVLAVYTGNSVDALTLCATNDNADATTHTSSLTNLQVLADTTYYIAIDGSEYSDSDSVTLTWLFNPSGLNIFSDLLKWKAKVNRKNLKAKVKCIDNTAEMLPLIQQGYEIGLCTSEGEILHGPWPLHVKEKKGRVKMYYVKQKKEASIKYKVKNGKVKYKAWNCPATENLCIFLVPAD